MKSPTLKIVVALLIAAAIFAGDLMQALSV